MSWVLRYKMIQYICGFKHAGWLFNLSEYAKRREVCDSACWRLYLACEIPRIFLRGVMGQGQTLCILIELYIYQKFYEGSMDILWQPMAQSPGSGTLPRSKIEAGTLHRWNGQASGTVSGGTQDFARRNLQSSLEIFVCLFLWRYRNNFMI